jgi:hypothetical protein
MTTADYSFEAMLEFMEYAGDKGLIKLATTRAYRSAGAKVSEDLTEQEAADVRQIDPDVVFQRYVNRNKVQVKPKTLGEYKQRMTRMVREFVHWREDPTAYKPRGASSTSGSKPARSSKSVAKGKRGVQSTEPESAAPEVRSEPVTMLALNLPYPLRPDFLATVQVPRDMTSAEAARLAAFVRTLATDFEPTG